MAVNWSSPNEPLLVTMLPTLIVVAVTPASLAVLGLLAPDARPDPCCVVPPFDELLPLGPTGPPLPAPGGSAPGAALLPPPGSWVPLSGAVCASCVPPLAVLPAATKSLIGRRLPQAVSTRQAASAINVATRVLRRTSSSSSRTCPEIPLLHVRHVARKGRSHLSQPTLSWRAQVRWEG